MQQFTVPQFIDIESKIIGPITTRQFVIFLGAAVIIGLSYRLFDFSLFIVVTGLVILIAILFSFVKINGRPFHLFLLNATQTLRRPSLRVWNNSAVLFEEIIEPEPLAKKEAKPAPKEYYKKSRLAEVALIVDTKGRYKGE